MNVIGITGPTGSGKSLVCSFLAEHNIPCIDADEVYHKMLLPPSECLDSIRAAFGNEIFLPDGNLDRAALAEIVFKDSKKLELLNKTVLDKVLAEIRTIISGYEQNGFATVAVDAPTLIESGFHKECSTVISVLAPREQRLLRIIERDSLTEQKADARINAQKSDSFYTESSDYVIINDADSQKLKDQLFDILKKLGIKSEGDICKD